jgi:hypothetical protein
MNFDQCWAAILELGPNGGNLGGLHYWIVRRTFKNGKVRETLFIQSDNAAPNAPWRVKKDTAQTYYSLIQNGITEKVFGEKHSWWFYQLCIHYLNNR